MAKDWSNIPVFAPGEYPPDSLLVADVPKTMRLIMDRINTLVPDVYRQGVRVGHIIPWFWNPIPDGALECNGQTYDTTKYADLYSILGSNKVPDLRGQFLRGWGNGSTDIDPDGGTRTLGSIQYHSIERIKGTFPADIAQSRLIGNSVSGAFADIGSIGPGDDGYDNPAEVRVYEFDSSRVVNSSSETRPTNIATKWVIIAIGSNKLVDGSLQLTDINLSPSPISGAVGSTGLLVPTPVPLNAPLGNLTFLAANSSIININATTGQYELLEKGFTTVTVVNQDGISKTVAVNVIEAITSLEVVFPTSMNLNSYEYPILTVLPAGVDYSVTYKIIDDTGAIDTTYAVVDLDGRVNTLDVEGVTYLSVTVTGLDGSTLNKVVMFNVVKSVKLDTVVLTIDKEIPVGTQKTPTLTISPAGLQVIVDWKITYNPIFGSTVAVVDPGTGVVTGLYANAPAVLTATVRDLQGTVKTVSTAFVVTNANWFVEKVYCRMDIVPADTVFYNGEEFKVRIIDKLGVMDFTQISADYLTGYTANADLVSTVKAQHTLEYTLKFKDNVPAGTILQLDWLPTEATKTSGDTGWPTTGDPVEYCQCRNWTVSTNGINSVGVPKLKLTYINGYDTYNGVIKEAIIIDENNFLDFTAHHGSNSITAVTVSLGSQPIVTTSMVRVPGIFFPTNTAKDTKGGIRWTSKLRSDWFVQDFLLNSLGNAPSFVIEFNTVDNNTYRASVTSTNGDLKSPTQDRVFKARIRDANGVTDFTALQTANDWSKFTFNNTYRTGNMTVNASFIEFEIRLNNSVAVGGVGGFTWIPNSLVSVTSSGITSTGVVLSDLSIKVIGDVYDVSMYTTQTMPILVSSPSGKYPTLSGVTLGTWSGAVAFVNSGVLVTIDGTEYVVGYLRLDTTATTIQAITIKHDSADTSDVTVRIQGLGTIPSNTNINTNGLVINIPKQFTGSTSKATATVASNAQIPGKSVVLFGDADIQVVAGSVSIVGTNMQFNISTGGAARTASVKMAPASGTYVAADKDALLSLVGE